MIALLLYLIGLVAVLATLVVAAFDVPTLYGQISAAYASGLTNLLPALGAAASSLNWALTPFLGGLLLMGFARIMILLGSINRALRGPA